LLSIMILDPLFDNNDKTIIDESISFFLAGTLTQASTLSNTLAFIMQNPETMEKARESLAKNFKAFANEDATLDDLAKELDMDTFEMLNDDYLKYCFNESLRIDPPIPMSTSFMMTEDIDIGGVRVKANDMLTVVIYQLHHNEDQWGADHDKFRPERFALTAKKHHPMSFLPFFAGKRVCVGKTFTENAFKVVFPLLLKAFPRMEFVNKEHYKEKPINNILMEKKPEIQIVFYPKK